MPQFYTHETFEQYERQVGHPSEPLPLVIREAYAIAREPVPQNRRRMLTVITPPPPGRCAHCGTETARDQNVRAHAVAGFEEAHDLESGELLRMLVTHCPACTNSEACHRERVTPGSGWAQVATPGQLVGPGGFCEPVERALTTGMVLFPGAQYLARWGKAVIGLAGLYLLSNLVVTSQGQQVADLSGPTTSLIVPGDATAGHGFNAGLLRVLSGSAPATANAAETGTLLISWTMPATAFPSATAALPSVATANAISNVSASASGTAGYARLVEQADSGFGLSTTLRRYQLTVGAGSGELSFNTLTISSGGTCSCTSFAFTHGT